MGSRPKPVIDLAEVERLAARGLSQEQICHCIGISPATLYKYKKTNTEFAEALKRGQSRGVKDITNALYTQAMEGNTAAAIFFLKNRDRDAWKDKQDLEHSGGTENTITVVDAGCGHVGPDADNQS